MFETYIAGVSFSDGMAQIAVLELRGKKVRVRHLEEFKSGDSDTLWYLGPILSRSNKLFGKLKRVSLALDHSEVIIHGFPMDNSLTPADQTEHINWELSNLVSTSSHRELVKDVHTLTTHAADQFSDMLVVAANRTRLIAVQQALEAHHIDLAIADTYFFAGSYALLANYPDVLDQTVALVLVTEHRIDLGIFDSGKLRCYTTAQLTSHNDRLDFIHNQCVDKSIGCVYCFGTTATYSLVNATKQRLRTEGAMLNPTRLYTASRKFHDVDQFAGQEHRYAAAIGCALGKQ